MSAEQAPSSTAPIILPSIILPLIILPLMILPFPVIGILSFIIDPKKNIGGVLKWIAEAPKKFRDARNFIPEFKKRVLRR